MSTAVTLVPLRQRSDEQAHGMRLVREARAVLHGPSPGPHADRHGQARLDAPPDTPCARVAAQRILDPVRHTLNRVRTTAGPQGALAGHRTRRLRAGVIVTHVRPAPAPPLPHAVVAATRRAVQVAVVPSHRDALPTTDPAGFASASDDSTLPPTGVDIREHPDGEPCRLIEVDDRRATFGSCNGDDASFVQLTEATHRLARRPGVRSRPGYRSPAVRRPGQPVCHLRRLSPVTATTRTGVRRLGCLRGWM